MDSHLEKAPALEVVVVAATMTLTHLSKKCGLLSRHIVTYTTVERFPSGVDNGCVLCGVFQMRSK
eukprot:SAG31_NODE_921_length_10984_cov_2.779329_4_plen_65_part_00